MPYAEYELNLESEIFVASSSRVLFHPNSKSLLLADCHFGKAAHFRKNNIPIPLEAAQKDYDNLAAVLDFYKPQFCLFLGDLFHSTHNLEWNWLQNFIAIYKQIGFTLIKGNHDILPKHWYDVCGLNTVEHLIFGEKFLLTHEPTETFDLFNICGHIHPGFSISGKGKQHISLPCFYKTHKRLILPSFGSLTGYVKMNKVVPGEAICFTKKAFFNIENP